jgi:hypothetical protein
MWANSTGKEWAASPGMTKSGTGADTDRPSSAP